MKQLVLAVILLLPAFALAANAAATDTPADRVGPENHKPPDAGLKQRLMPLQYAVTQQEDTERAFHNEYWDEKREGIYVDVVSGEPLFSSQHKSRSGTGWPSFYRALEDENITTRPDNSLIFERTELRSSHADSHLGHLFQDGPEPTGLRLRLCLSI